ncbi:type II methionyl aminopeptidase [Candidatus Woesearchaeota archaeon]|nr:type II methionyl aminopeptidase [Candidatus Woesearchaeota archaeon]
MSNEQNFEDYKKAGKIAAEVREFAKKIVKVDGSLLEATELIEQQIIKLGGRPAFPIDMSLNNIAAHYSATINDKTVFKENNLVKVDIGVHINGAVADTAVSIDLGNNRELIKAAELALLEALKLVKPGIKILEIGAVIQQTIQDFGFSPIRNLSGHGLELYKVHTKPNIPNINNGDKNILQENQIIAIEPFATNGAGLIINGKPSEIYELKIKKPIRNQSARKLLSFIEQEYRTLPFNKRWLLNKFNNLDVSLGLSLLEREGILYQYSILPEKNDGIVSQAEHTVIVKDDSIITTNL